MTETRVYGSIPFGYQYYLIDWINKQPGIHRCRYNPGKNQLSVTFESGATPKQRNRIGRTMAWDGIR